MSLLYYFVLLDICFWSYFVYLVPEDSQENVQLWIFKYKINLDDITRVILTLPKKKENCCFNRLNCTPPRLWLMIISCKQLRPPCRLNFLFTHHLHFLQASPPPPQHHPSLQCDSGIPSSSAGGRWESQTVQWGRRGTPPQRLCRVGDVPPPQRLLSQSYVNSARVTERDRDRENRYEHFWVPSEFELQLLKC